MKTLVVYDSLYGNTRAIAQAIGDALPGEVEVLHADRVNPGDLEAADLLVLGSPTHGSLPSETMQGLLEKIGAPSRPGAQAATFDTRLTWGFLERWGGFAAPKMAEKLEAKGWSIVAPPEGFFVRGLKKGPLKKGEAERASSWARRLEEGQA